MSALVDATLARLEQELDAAMAQALAGAGLEKGAVSLPQAPPTAMGQMFDAYQNFLGDREIEDLVNVPHRQVHLWDLLATQADVRDDFVEDYRQNPGKPSRDKEGFYPDEMVGVQRPHVARHNGRNFILDGHHRVEAAKQRGERMIEVDYTDLDAEPVAKAAAPLTPMYFHGIAARSPKQQGDPLFTDDNITAFVDHVNGEIHVGDTYDLLDGEDDTALNSHRFLMRAAVAAGHPVHGGAIRLILRGNGRFGQRGQEVLHPHVDFSTNLAAGIPTVEQTTEALRMLWLSDLGPDVRVSIPYYELYDVPIASALREIQDKTTSTWAAASNLRKARQDEPADAPGPKMIYTDFARAQKLGFDWAKFQQEQRAAYGSEFLAPSRHDRALTHHQVEPGATGDAPEAIEPDFWLEASHSFVRFRCPDCGSLAAGAVSTENDFVECPHCGAIHQANNTDHRPGELSQGLGRKGMARVRPAPVKKAVPEPLRIDAMPSAPYEPNTPSLWAQAQEAPAAPPKDVRFYVSELEPGARYNISAYTPDDKALGSILIGLEALDSPNFTVEYIRVRQAYQRQGLATRLYTEAGALARKMGRKLQGSSYMFPAGRALRDKMTEQGYFDEDRIFQGAAQAWLQKATP